ncbi:penicillin-binding transpeptidase domain-containing protein [Kitasatospora sp. McL0602]|uniref:penicillin-binding transpeptidase domain-containing protein n=1 Tax=Kitasatospora sp. McL0602 TaxID=3439530 RepID=UPI003F8A5166
MDTMHKGMKIGVAAVCTGMLAVAGYGVYSFVDTGSSTKTADAPKERTVVAEPPGADLAAAGEKAFLDAWAKGDLAGASALTDKPEAALTALTAFQNNVKPSALTLTPGAAPTTSPSPTATASSSASAAPAPAGQVLLGFKAKAEFAATANAWTYDGLLGVVKMSDGTAAVHWAPSVIHPHLDSGETITVKPIFAQPGTVLDRNGKSLKGYASLDPLLANFKSQAAANPSDAGQGVVITDDSGAKPAEQLFAITDPKPAASLKLTLDVNLQRAAEDAVKKQAGHTGIVAIEPSTGGILAIANNPASYNWAFLSALAPGSTMKVITAAALLEAGVKPDATMACPADFTVSGQHYKNDFAEPHPEYTFLQDFAQSCNTAFIQQGLSTLKGTELADTAKQVFGLGPVWKTGLKLAPPKVPAPTTPNQRAAEFIGQGTITMNALSMASVAATVQNGTFHQPTLTAGAEQQPADRQLSPGTLDALRSMMRLVVTGGTAANVPGLPSGTGAKTGTAQVNNQATDNSWFTSFSGNLAVAATVEGGGHGAAAAGPAAAEVLSVGNR